MSAKRGRIRDIKVSMESGELPDLSEHIIWPKHTSLCACTLCACMLGPISQPNWVGSERSKYLWNQENTQDLSGHKIWQEHTSLCACTLCACVLRPKYQPNWVWSERWRYLWNQENLPDLSEFIMWHKLACMNIIFLGADQDLCQILLCFKDKGIYESSRLFPTSHLQCPRRNWSRTRSVQ